MYKIYNYINYNYKNCLYKYIRCIKNLQQKIEHLYLLYYLF